MSMNVFEEAYGTEFHHWIRDPILLSNSRSCLKSFLYVLGIHVALGPIQQSVSRAGAFGRGRALEIVLSR